MPNLARCVIPVLLLSLAGWFPASAPADPETLVPVDVPAAAGSIGPRLVPGSDGPAILSWVEPTSTGHALRFSRWDDNGWQPAETVSSGGNWFVNWADFPAVVPVDGDFWVAHWLVRRPAGGYAYDIHVAVSTDGGRSWSDGRALHDDATDSEHGFVSYYADASAARLVWLDGRRMASDPAGGMTLRTARLQRDGTISSREELDELVCDCCQTDVAAGVSGPVVVYRNRTIDEVRDIYVTQHDGRAWQPPVAVADDNWVIGGCPVNGPAIAGSGEQLAVAWFSAANDTPRVRLARSTDGGRTFGEAKTLLSGALLGHVRLLLLDDGNALLSVVHGKAAPGAGGAHLVLHVDGPGKRALAPDGLLIADDVAALSVPQLAAVEGGALLAWTAKAADGKHVLRSALLPTAVLPGKHVSAATF